MQTHEYLLVLEDSEVPEAEIYHSEESVSFLVLSERIPDSTVLRLKTAAVETIARDMISQGADGTITLSPDVVFHEEGQFEVGADGISFTVEGIHFLLKSSQ